MKKKLVPELRFPEFSGEWEEKNLGDVLIERNVKCKDGDYEVISSTTNGLYYQKDYFNRDIASDDKSGYKILEKEQIVFSPQNLWMGNINFNDSIDIGIVSPSYKIYDIKKNYYPYFIKHIIKTPYMMYQYLQSSEQGASVVRRNLNIELFYSCKVSIPSIEEQKKLASFFNLIDKKIEKQEEKIASMEEYKKGMLQKLFPKKGENVPELRFKGFTAPWEQRKLGEIAKFSKGRGYSKNDLTEEGTPIILYGSLYTNYKTVINEVNTFTVDKVNSVYSLGNEVVVPSSGESAEDIARASAIVNKGIILGGDLNIIHSNSNIDPIFLALLISNGERKIELAKKAQGKSVVHLYNTDLEEVNLIYPTREEQTRISDFFSSIDNLITLHQRKLEELKELKKGFMQKMFI